MACFVETLLVVLLCGIFPSVSTDEAEHLNFTSFRDLLISSHQESLRIVDESSRRAAPPPSKHAFRQSEPETLEISRAAEVFQTTLQVVKNKARQRFKREITATELFSWDDVKLIAKLSLCHPAPCPNDCQRRHLDKYRSISGICNNRQNPLWGVANSPLVRWLPAEYEDGLREPKGWNRGRLYNEFQLPPPWEVSKKILSTSSKYEDNIYSHLLVDWGQYISHDISFTPQSPPDADCLTACENVHRFFPIQMGDTDGGARRCMPFFRSSPACFIHFGPDVKQTLQEQQLNTITSFIDASTVYGSSPKQESVLRDLSGRNGKLAVNHQYEDPDGRSYLPFVPTLPSNCRQDLHGERVECFNAGDVRVTESMPLTSIHTLWLRKHNEIAESLKHINAHWSPEMIYQETRKIVGALHQIITMRDYIPKIIGGKSCDHFIGPYGGYDPTVNPSVSNVFATAAFRFGHATIAPILRRLNESFQEDEHFPHLRLHDTLFSPWRIVKEGGIEPTLRGIIGTPAAVIAADKLVAEDLAKRLVVPNLPRQHMDLASLNLQRGRDHALPGYNDWREFCGLKRIKTLDDLKEVVKNCRVAEKILKIYKHPDNIDVWLGGLVESFLPDSRTGPLFACLIGKQMKAIRDGDRFWWEAEGVFTKQQRAELSKGSLSQIICENSDIREIPLDSFMHREYPSQYVSCDHIPSMNLEAWREEKNPDLERCGPPGQIENGDFILSPCKLVAEYSCYHGFKMNGAAAIVCEGGRWSGEPPQCIGNHSEIVASPADPEMSHESN